MRSEYWREDLMVRSAARGHFHMIALVIYSNAAFGHDVLSIRKPSLQNAPVFRSAFACKTIFPICREREVRDRFCTQDDGGETPTPNVERTFVSL